MEIVHTPVLRQECLEYLSPVGEPFESPTMQETWVQPLGQEDPLEKKMATHSSILAWKIPWTEEPGRLHSKGSQREQLRTSLHFNCLIT